MSDQDLDHAWSLLQQVGARRNNEMGPVMVGRELLVVAWKMLTLENGTENSQTCVLAAVSAFMAGVITPRGTEYQIDGIEFGRCDALMWLGIASGMLLPHDGIIDSDVVPSRPSILQTTSDPAALAVASYGFESIGEYLKAGRCAEEYAELLRMYGRTFVDQFERAASLFERAGNSSRAKTAVIRKTDGSYSRQSFFYQEHPTGDVTTIVGSREYMTIRNQIRMG
jgi:hypothetical protein